MNPPKLAYLAGQMRGLHRYGFPIFHHAAHVLRGKGWEIISPAEMDEDLGFNPDLSLEDNNFNLQEAMHRDISALLRCDSIVLLPNWRNSEGAKLELAIAQALGLSVFSYSEGKLTSLDGETICEEADRLVEGARQDAYGPPEQDLGRTGRLWAGILGLPEITAVQVALCMAAVKISRLCQTPDHRDSVVDIAGYARCIELIQEAS